MPRPKSTTRLSGGLILSACALALLPACGRKKTTAATIDAGAINEARAAVVALSENHPELAATFRMATAHAPLRQPEVADPDSEANRWVLTQLTRRALRKPPRSPVPTPPVPPPDSALVGTLKGEFSVDNRGAGDYTIELPVPAGRGDIYPYPTIAYNTDGGDGILGWRFSFGTGFYRAITRGRTLLARDGFVRSQQLAMDDQLYLDGKRLVCITPPESRGLPGSVYRTEVDSFVRITATGEGDRITGFTLENKYGRTYTFGTDGDETDGLHAAYDEDTQALTPVVPVYALKRVEDRLGNYAKLDYRHAGFGEWLLDRYRYTGSPEAAPLFDLRFRYSPKSHVIPTYEHGYRSDSRHRLDLIELLADEHPVPVASFKLDYESDRADGAHHLTRIRASLSADIGTLMQDLAPTHFIWSAGKARVGEKSQPSVSPRSPDVPPTSTRHALGDFNGDGKSDTLFAHQGVFVALSTARGFGPKSQEWYSAGDLRTHLSADSNVDLRIDDLDGDGRSDVLALGPNATVLPLYSEGSSFVAGPVIDLSSLIDTATPTWFRSLQTGDVNGDGRSDVSFISDDGNVHVWIAANRAWIARNAASLDASLAPDQDRFTQANDMNGDGAEDLMWLQGSAEHETDATHAPTLRLRLALSRPQGGFTEPITINEWTTSTGAALVDGDFNGDGLDDFLVHDADAGWSLLLNRGSGLPPAPTAFTRIEAALPRLSLDRLRAGTSYQSKSPSGVYPDTGLGLDAGLGLQSFDLNRDGRDDLIWLDRSAPTTPPQWWSQLSRGDGTFEPATVMEHEPWANQTPRPGERVRIVSVIDINGDGFADPVLALTNSQTTQPAFRAWVSDATDHDDTCGFSHLVTRVVNGTSRTLDLVYHAAKDDRIYAPGAPVAYPLLEFRSWAPVISDVWHTAGGNEYSHFSYVYAGNRLDFSGRGGVGFCAFMTHDRTTDFIKYQHVEHSYPLTGLTRREQTYRFWKAQDKLHLQLLTTTDATNTFDLVRDPFTGQLHGTVFSLVAREVERRPSSILSSHYRYSAASIDQDDPNHAWFEPQRSRSYRSPSTTETWFDEAAPSAEVDLRYPFVFLPWQLSETLPALRPDAAASLQLPPGRITYGNETTRYSDKEEQDSTTVETRYYPPQESTDPLTSLVYTQRTYEGRPPFDREIEPSESYSYFANTRLQETASTDGRHLSDPEAQVLTETRYTRDALGRIEKRHERTTRLKPAEETRSPPDETADDSEAAEDNDGKERLVYLGEDFNSHSGRPYWENDTRYGPRTTTYNLLFDDVASIDYESGGRIRSLYDGLGRSVRVENLDTDYLRETTLAWTHPHLTGWQQTQTVKEPRPGPGITGTSVYAERISKTGEPTRITYYDRLDRVIRVVLLDENDHATVSDTVYNMLGSESALASNYVPGADVTWELITYDAFGSVDRRVKYISKGDIFSPTNDLRSR